MAEPSKLEQLAVMLDARFIAAHAMARGEAPKDDSLSALVKAQIGGAVLDGMAIGFREAARMARDLDSKEKGEPGCQDCGRSYSDGGFPDLVIDDDAWRQISPTGDDGGLLCPSCICKRLHDAGIKCCGAFRSGPLAQGEG